MKKKPQDKQSVGKYTRFTPSEGREFEAFVKKNKYESEASFIREVVLGYIRGV